MRFMLATLVAWGLASAAGAAELTTDRQATVDLAPAPGVSAEAAPAVVAPAPEAPPPSSPAVASPSPAGGKPAASAPDFLSSTKRSLGRLWDSTAETRILLFKPTTLTAAPLFSLEGLLSDLVASPTRVTRSIQLKRQAVPRAAAWGNPDSMMARAFPVAPAPRPVLTSDPEAR